MDFVIFAVRVEMGLARVRALTHTHTIADVAAHPIVEMGLARVRALTQKKLFPILQFCPLM